MQRIPTDVKEGRKKEDDVEEEGEEEEYDHPEDKASIFCRLMVFWIFPLINIASQRQLQEADVYKTPRKQSVKHDGKLIIAAWNKEKENAIKENREPNFGRAIFDSFFYLLVRGGCCQFGFLISQLAMPQMVGMLIKYVTTGDGGIQYGVGCALGLAAISLASSICITGKAAFEFKFSFFLPFSFPFSFQPHLFFSHTFLITFIPLFPSF